MAQGGQKTALCEETAQNFACVQHGDGILKMVEENRYCIDISQQLMATEAILNRANKEILAAHLKHCVQCAASEEEREAKIDEFVSTLDRILK